MEFNAFSDAPGNPGFPVGAEIKGVKFDFGSESPAIYSFMSNRAPVYGDFYSKGGNASFAYNAGLVNHGSGSITDFVVRPDGAIPEPASISLIALGLILGVTARLRR